MVYQERFRAIQRVGLTRHWARALHELLLPARCICCGQSGPSQGDRSGPSWPTIDLCSACHAQLPTNQHACFRCALPLPGEQTGLVCGSCLRRPPPYQSSYCAFAYAYPLEQLIQRLKYSGSFSTARVLGNLLAQYLQQQHAGAWPNCIVPVPLHAIRFRERGYNQAIELGRFVAATLHVPLRTDLLQRSRHTPEQVGLSRRERRQNLHRAFVPANVLMPQHVALLDDVITTGSTAAAAAHALRRAGVRQIEVWGLARAGVSRARAKP